MQRCRYLPKLLLVILAASHVLSSPTPKNEVEEIFSGSKRDVSSAATSSILKSALFNPYMYPGIFPGKPFFYPFLAPPEILLSRFAKSTPVAEVQTPQTPLQTSPAVADYFKSKKDEFLAKLFEKISNETEITTRSVTPAPEDPSAPTKPTIDPSFFLNKKLDFLEKLFKSLNTTTATPTGVTEATDAVSTPKPTIVPPGFWFPFIKPPKPPKAPKPTKPPKAKKVLKDALDTMILQSILAEFGIDPLNGTLNKRGVVPPAGAKKAKSKKVKADEEPTEFHIPTKIDPALYSAKASDCLDKLFKILSKADAEDIANFIEPKATVVPPNLWTQPSETEYTSKLDAFLDLLIKSLNATEVATQKPAKSKKFESKVIKKRSTFLDELLHRIPPSPSPAPTTPETKCTCTTKTCCCGDCGEEVTADKSARSLAFKPFGTGYWIPQYLYATKMSMYLDKLMDTINSAAAEDTVADGTSLKRSLVGTDGKVNITGMSPKEAALTLLIAELVDVKNDIVEAFGDGVKAQKTATSAKPFNPAAKSFKKPFWGPKAAPTADPVEPIQKRIDILNDIFDKITEVEKTLLFADDTNDPGVISSIKNTLKPEAKTGSTRLGASSKFYQTEATPQDGGAPESPDYYLEKTRDFLKSLYGSKIE
ncbi:UNVERIFIED_CONTAM: hypothetical protein PYX00_000460 [Menopon gallinae]|uniref:Uncharacterized protein n=1 Tax=Menopon gallinae TaxID=328185 RepID=A0AAW2IAA2_9NEOP